MMMVLGFIKRAVTCFTCPGYQVTCQTCKPTLADNVNWRCLDQNWTHLVTISWSSKQKYFNSQSVIESAKIINWQAAHSSLLHLNYCTLLQLTWAMSDECLHTTNMNSSQQFLHNQSVGVCFKPINSHIIKGLVSQNMLTVEIIWRRGLFMIPDCGACNTLINDSSLIINFAGDRKYENV